MSETPGKGEMSMSEAGKRGGAVRREVLGTEGFRAMGKKGGGTTKARHGAEHYQRIGKMGGQATAAKGKEYYQKIGRMGAEVRLNRENTNEAARDEHQAGDTGQG